MASELGAPWRSGTTSSVESARTAIHSSRGQAASRWVRTNSPRVAGPGTQRRFGADADCMRRSGGVHLRDASRGIRLELRTVFDSLDHRAPNVIDRHVLGNGQRFSWFRHSTRSGHASQEGVDIQTTVLPELQILLVDPGDLLAN